MPRSPPVWCSVSSPASGGRSSRTVPLGAVTREALERHQVWWYLVAAVSGLVLGTVLPDIGGSLDFLVWPVLALLLFATFSQVPLAAIPETFRDGRFLATVIAGNFVLLPLIVWVLVSLTPDDDALRLGLLLVLLVPCTDWFITFTQLGRGDTARSTAVAPLLLLVQLGMLPVYLWLMAGPETASVFSVGEIWPAFLVLLVPLAAATVIEFRLRRHPAGERVRDRLGYGPVPLLSLVIFLVAAGHAGPAGEALHVVPVVIAVATAFLVSALVLAKVLGAVLRLPVEQGRTLAFTFGTRNSFIVLPFALSLSAGWEVVAVVVVMQSLVELFGMMFFLWFVPGVLFRADRPDRATGQRTGGAGS